MVSSFQRRLLFLGYFVASLSHAGDGEALFGRKKRMSKGGRGDIMGPEKGTSGKAEKKEEVENSLDTKKNAEKIRLENKLEK